MKLRTRDVLALATITSLALAPASGLPADSAASAAQGLWMASDKGAVIEFKACGERSESLCGRIVWDNDAGKPSSTCGVQIAELHRFTDDAWRDGWVFDPRDNRKYKGALRVTGRQLTIRAFIGVEVLGQTETMTRVDALPAKPVCGS